MTFKPGDRVVFVNANNEAHWAEVTGQGEYNDERGVGRVDITYEWCGKVLNCSPHKARVGRAMFHEYPLKKE